VYGLLLQDVYVWGPNSLGVVCTMTQLALIARYPSRPSKSDEEKGLGAQINLLPITVAGKHAHTHDKPAHSGNGIPNNTGGAVDETELLRRHSSP
jgi:hypothetical protein